MKSKFETKGDDLYIDGNKVIKAYEGCNGWRWFAIEEACTQNAWIDGKVVKDDIIYYGLVQGDEDEWGNFSKAELEALMPSKHVREINKCDLAKMGEKFEMIVIQNNGKEIIGTNYFDTEGAKRGLAFLSMNGGGIRLLLPDKMPEYILGTDSSAEYADDLVDGMKTANHVVLSRGSSKAFQKQDMLEILFEDHSNTPYCFYMTTEQCHALPRNQDIGYELDFSVWTKDGKQLSKPCYYRTVNDIPCMKPFPVHKRKHRR